MTKTFCSWPRFAALLLLTFAGLTTSPAAAYYREACWVKVSTHVFASARSQSIHSGSSLQSSSAQLCRSQMRKLKKMVGISSALVGNS